MKTLLSRLLVIGACTLITGTSMAEVVRITGKTCKNHLRGAEIDWTELYHINLFYKNVNGFPGGFKAPMGKLELKDGMHPYAKKHIADFQKVISDCEKHCKGLKFNSGTEFLCKKQLPLANADQLHFLIRSEDQLKDDAQGDVVAFPTAEPVVIAGENFTGIDETLFINENPAPTALSPQVEIKKPTNATSVRPIYHIFQGTNPHYADEETAI